MSAPAVASPKLPRSVAALSRMFYAAPDEQSREQIMEAIRAEFPARATPHPSQALRRSPQARLYVRRVLACIGQPIIEHTRGLPDTVAYSQLYALRDLVHFDPAPVVPLLRKMARGAQLVREEAVLHLAWTGLDRVVPDVKRFLKSGDPRVIEPAARGAGLAAWHKLATRKYRIALFDTLVPLVTGPWLPSAGADLSSASCYAAETLIRLDRAKGLRLLKSRACLHAENDQVWDILTKLHAERAERPRTFGAPIDPRVLWPLFDATLAATAGVTENRRAWTCALILTFTADRDPDRTRREAKALQNASAAWPGYKGSEEIKEGLRRCKGVPEARAMLDRLDRSPRAFPRKFAEVVRAFELGEHVIGDGLVLYFHNCASSFEMAISGLRALGFAAVAAKVRAAARIVQPGPKPRTPQSMRKAVLALSESQQGRLVPFEKSVERAAPAIIAAAERYLESNLKTPPSRG